MNQRFSYVKYDEKSAELQEKFKALFEQIEQLAESPELPVRPKALLLTYLEIAYAWSGKMIRDAQLERGSQTAHVAERG